MNLILTMAGRYSRFVQEGYRLPKYLLPWGARSILNEIILELNSQNDFENIYLIANRRDSIFMPHVNQIIKSVGIPLENLFLISDTSGQAETASNGIQEVIRRHGSLNGKIIFHNIDTILYNRNISMITSLLDLHDGYIDIFESNSNELSYVFEENGNVKSIAEKIVISNNATSGLYAFKDINIFNKFYKNDISYISDIYKEMIKKKSSIVTGRLHTSADTIVLGTPSEYLDRSSILDAKKI